MNIWFDLGHIPQYNFTSAMIRTLAQQGHIVYITVLKRGRLLPIVQTEMASYPNVHVVQIGEHGMNAFSAIWNANIKRILKMIWWARGKHIDCAISSTLPCALVCKLIGARMYAYTDDTQRGTYPWIIRFCTSETNLLVPPVGKLAEQKTTVLNALKEWAYLNPRTFKPNVKVLEKYGVQPKQYLFLREVSVGTVNYAAQSPQAILSISPLIQQFTQWGQSLLCNSSSSDPTITQKGQTPLCNIQENSPVCTEICTEGQSPCANFKILFSLEEKHRRSEYPADWILLQEPIEDIHSLMYYAAGLVSSGDSMAREAALLGIPAYYLGVRHSMPANLAASKVANLKNEKTQPFEQWLREVIGKSEVVRTREQEDVRRKIDEEFIDINQYMLSLVEGEKELNR